MNNKVLVKLAQTRLAINHVLRQRLEKRAFNIPDYKTEDDRHRAELLRNRFSSYNEEIPTTTELTPRTVSNKKINPYLSNEAQITQFYNKSDPTHVQLFGVPTMRTGRRTDRQIYDHNSGVVSKGLSDNATAYWQNVYDPLMNSFNRAMGFPMDQQDRNLYTNIREKDIYNDTTGMEPGTVHTYSISPFTTSFDFPGEIKTDDQGDYIMRTALSDTGPQIQLPQTVFPEARQLYGQLRDARDTYDELSGLASDAQYNYMMQGRNVLSNKNFDAYRNHRDQLMHAYINQSPVGQAFASHPSVMTGIPYAAYHAMPYLWKGNQPRWMRQGTRLMQQGINNVKNLYNNSLEDTYPIRQQNAVEAALEPRRRDEKRLIKRQKREAERQKNQKRLEQLSVPEISPQWL